MGLAGSAPDHRAGGEREGAWVRVLYERCAGIDVHKDPVTVAVRLPGPGPGGRDTRVRKFAAFCGVLREMTRWLASRGVSHVAMGATGVCTMPVYHALLEPGCFGQVLVCNAAHVKNVPGRKTGAVDASWLAELLECGLLAGSFIPPARITAVRDVVRYRRKIVQERAAETRRLGGVLQDAGIKLDSVASSIDTVSGMAMIGALIDGERRGQVLAGLARGVMRAKIADLSQALEGRFDDHHALMCQLHLDHIAHLNEMTATLDAQAEAMMVPFTRQRDLLATIPGISLTAAAAIISEIGPRPGEFFTTGAHLASWAGLCPGSHETGRQAQTRQAPQRQPAPAAPAGGMRLVRGPHQRAAHSPLPPAGAALRRLPQPRRQETGHRRHCPHPRRDHLAHAGHRQALHRPWPGLLHHPQRPGKTSPAAHRQTQSPRPQGHSRTRSVNTRSQHPAPLRSTGCCRAPGWGQSRTRRCRTTVRCSRLPGEIARRRLIAGHVVQPRWRRLWVSRTASGL
jgi:transposase